MKYCILHFVFPSKLPQNIFKVLFHLQIGQYIIKCLNKYCAYYFVLLCRITGGFHQRSKPYDLPKARWPQCLANSAADWGAEKTSQEQGL